jgi:glycosyltransferase involved in cell wall biosynthesis
VSGPEVSIVIPVYDEQAILYDAVAGLLERLGARGVSFEVVLAENGSRDRTLEVARELESRHAEVRHLSLPEPNYGQALKRGILAARGAIVVADEIDLLDVDFQVEAIGRVRAGADLVIGSKLMAGARDERPFFRHLDCYRSSKPAASTATYSRVSSPSAPPAPGCPSSSCRWPSRRSGLRASI